AALAEDGGGAARLVFVGVFGLGLLAHVTSKLARDGFCNLRCFAFRATITMARVA
ncbi:MAG: hypothetical protein GY832_00860, partial [Chloroflexi bacterium]|nr:hypothetical protein [Chloroflexota bacterium]